MRYYSKPDLNAPRHRPKRYLILNEDFVKRIHEKFPKTKHLKLGDLKNIIGKFNDKIWETVIDNRDGVELPNNLGYIFIGVCQRPTKYNKNYINSKEYKTDIRHRNYETDEKLAKIFYSNYSKKYLFKNRDLWEFKGYRNFTRKVSETFSENWKRYVEVDKNSYISKILKREKAKDYAKKYLVLPDDYNEFNLE
jgi:hypothetical protein